MLFSEYAECVGCGERWGNDEPFLCERCAEELAALVPEPGEAYLDRLPEAVDGALFAFRYAPPASRLVVSMKYSLVYKIAGFFAAPMSDLLVSSGWGANAIALVPVPSPASRLRSRGFNQAELMAREVSRLSGIPLLQALIADGGRKRQVTLGYSARIANKRGAYKAASPLEPGDYILIDDVRTTGATLSACAMALKAAGAGRVYAITATGD